MTLNQLLKRQYHCGRQKNEIIDLALVVKKKRADNVDAPHKDMEMASAQPAAKQRPGPVGPATPNVEMKTFSRKSQATGSFKKETSALKEEHLSPSSSLEDTFNKVNELIRFAEGKTLSVKYDPNTGQPQSICVEIPPENYKSFSEKLRGLATLQPPLPTISEKGRAAVKIQIRFILE